MTKLSRRDAANIAAWRQGIPTTQVAIDASWAGIVAKLNATLPGTQEPIKASLASSTIGDEKTTRAAVDWSSIASALNREAGLATPTRSRVS